jgi:exopolyphosphatase/pppGpp-phosphohydrolase
LGDKDEKAQLDATILLAKSCGYEHGHADHVSALALKLFDELKSLHELSDKERYWLQNAAILCDIGWIEGQKNHHKAALRAILEDSTLLFDEHERLIIGLIARYHHGALPTKEHAHFSSLKKPDRKLVSILASILRVADGLDYSHQNVIKDIECEITPKYIIVKCSADRTSEMDREKALYRGQLMEKVFGKVLCVEWKI